MDESRIIGDFLLAKNFEDFTFRDYKNYSLLGLKLENLPSPGTLFLSILNNYNLIMDVLEKSITRIEKSDYDTVSFIVESIKDTDKTIAYFLRAELNNVINNNHLNIADLKRSLKQTNSAIKEAKKYEEFEFVEELKDDKAQITGKLNCYQNTSNIFKNYISTLIETIRNYKTYLDLYFGIPDNKDFKKKDLSYFQSFFNLQFIVPKYEMVQFYIEKNKIVLANDMLLDSFQNSKEEIKAGKYSNSNVYLQLFKKNQDLIRNHQMFTLKNYEISNLKDLLCVFFNYLFDNNITINKCKHCGKYFIPTNRSDEKYCDNPSPHDPNKTCKEIGAKLSFAEKRDSEPITKEHNKTKVALSMRISRAKKKNNQTEINKLNKRLEKYLSDYAVRFKQYQKRKISEEELIAWIISQKEI